MVIAFGFSKGCAVLALKKPPPLSPSASMGTMLATGPPGMVCCSAFAVLWVLCAATVVTVRAALKFWITPWLMSTIANTNDRGRRIRVVDRTVSTQKLPMVRLRRRMIARVNATATAIPTAAERYCWTTSPNIWVKWLIVSSPEYACQFVLVRKLTAVLNDSCGETAFMLSGFSGRCAWSRRTAYVRRTPARLNARSESA